MKKTTYPYSLGPVMTKNDLCGSTSNVCPKLFQTESDCKAHNIRVGEYGDMFQLYHCEFFGYSGNDISLIKLHINEEHSDLNESIKWLGIKKLPEITERRKQNFDGLQVNEEGYIEFDTEDEEDWKDSDNAE